MGNGRRLKILHVDDDGVNLHVLDEILKSFGHEPHAAASAGEALEALEHESFDLLITDLHMPDVNGQELMLAARKLERHGGPMPVLAVSADVMSHRPDEYIAMGFAGFLAKPLMFATLEAMLADLVGGGGGIAQGFPSPPRLATVSSAR